MSDAVITGGCLCGAVRYEVAGALRRITHCHCGMCRKAHGAAFATYAELARKRLRLVAGADALRRYASSPGVTREFCGTCGAPLFWSRDTTPDVLALTLGTVDGDPIGRPLAHIFVADRACWFELTDALPRYEGDEPPTA